MNCEEMIYSEDYMDFMFNYLEIIEGVEEFYRVGCINEIAKDIAVIHFPNMENGQTNLEIVPYSYIPKLFGLLDSSNMEITGVKQVQNPNNAGLTGRNVIVGLVDTGENVNIVSGIGSPLLIRDSADFGLPKK